MAWIGGRFPGDERGVEDQMKVVLDRALADSLYSGNVMPLREIGRMRTV